MDYKKVDRIADRIKNPTKKKSEDRMIQVIDKRTGQNTFVKKSEVMKDLKKYLPARSSYEVALEKAKAKEPGGRLSTVDVKRAIQSVQGKRKGGLTGGQKNLDKNKNNRIDAQDFKILKAEKAKGRGMGLQDEKVKPGKVQKAFLGKMIKGAGKSIGRLFGKKKSATATPGSVAMSKSGKGMGGKLPQLLQKAIDDGIIKTASKGRMMKNKKPMKAALGALALGKTMKDKDKPMPLGMAAAMLKKKKMKEIIGRSKGGESKSDKLKRAFPRKSPTGRAKIETMLGSKYTPMKRERLFAGDKARRSERLKKLLKNVRKAIPGPASLDVKVTKKSKGGGADAGRAGSIKGINAVLKDKAERRFNVPDKTDIKKQKASVTKLKQQARRSRLEKMKERQTGRPVYERMGGGMMNKPMGYKKGTMVMARGCKLGRKKPTKIM